MSADLVAAQSDELLSVLEQLPEGVFVIDSDARVVFANKPGLRLVKMKPKKALGEIFPYDVADGPMRDFDVEMMVKDLTWGGQQAKLVHLKPLKSAGAFHLEWKLESALEKARSAELMLEEWKSREGMASVAEPTQGQAAALPAELERALDESRQQLDAARAREEQLGARLDEVEARLAQQRKEFEDRQSELESLLEMAETRADELQTEVVSGDHQSATELQHAVALARDAEEQLRNLDEELSEARDRVRVAEEQAEVAEERAYSLEAELEKLSAELEELPKPEQMAALEQELESWRAKADESALELESLRAEAAAAAASPALAAEVEELTARLVARDEELAILTDRVEAKEEELAILASKLSATQEQEQSQSSARDGELASLTELLRGKDDELATLAERLQIQDDELTRKASELATLAGQLEAQENEILNLQADLKASSDRAEAEADGSEVLSSTLETLRAELDVARQDGTATAEALEAALAEAQALRTQLEEAEDTLRVRSEESDELAEQLRAETELSEELVDQLRQDNERLQEIARERTEELENLKASLQGHLEELEGLRQSTGDAEAVISELDQLKASHEALAQQHAEAQAELAETAELRTRVAELEANSEQVERLQKEVQKLSAQLEEAGDMAEKGERADKLERKLEGALRRAEEAEERLQEERRLLTELRQTSERRIAELESRGGRAGTAGEADPETERMAFQDPLTGLPNRNILHKYLGFMLQQSVRYERYTALLRIDCDKFKVISDTFGADVGDRLIRLVGERLSAVVRSSDVLGRLAEDEFVILLSELTDQKEASVVTASVIKRIYHMLKKPFAIDDQNISVSVSIGVSLYPLDAANGEQMFQHSADALKRAKDTGRGQAQYYTPEVQSSHEARVMLDHELKLGLERGEFGLLYQPIFDLSNGQIVGVEALIRWNHPRLGSIGPDEFLKVAEESGLIVLIGNWALRSALQRAAQWQAAGLGLFVSLNLSRRQLLQADLIPTIHTALAEFRCSPDRILLEISEELTGPELPRLRDTLSNLQQLGVRLAVDNFGTSASSLQELRRGPFQVLKIDRRFVRGVPAHEENAGIVLSALTLGHHLGRITVAVGVETEAEKAWLGKTGCRFAQGNLLAGPLPPEHVSEIVSRR
jgi:diguanylate cyclase (GGDEF)-like protein